MQVTCYFDPLCGWCYGATPALERIALMDGIELSLAPSGLFAGEGARSMDAGFSEYAWRNDQRIAQLTGLPFSEAYRTHVLGAHGGSFDSAPATLGIIAVGLSEPKREHIALKALQHARYVGGRDITDLAVIADTLAQHGFAEAAHRLASPDEALLAAYHQRVGAVRQEMAALGIQGVPALVAGHGPTRQLLPANLLFAEPEDLLRQLQGLSGQ